MITTQYNGMIATIACTCLFLYYTIALIYTGFTQSSGPHWITFLVCFIAWIVFNFLNFGALKWVILNLFVLPSFKR